jgi:hypothetical protein
VICRGLKWIILFVKEGERRDGSWMVGGRLGGGGRTNEDKETVREKTDADTQKRRKTVFTWGCVFARNR